MDAAIKRQKKKRPKREREGVKEEREGEIPRGSEETKRYLPSRMGTPVPFHDRTVAHQWSDYTPQSKTLTLSCLVPLFYSNVRIEVFKNL